MAFILENLGLTPSISIEGVFYRSYKVQLSLIIGTNTTIYPCYLPFITFTENTWLV